MDENVRIIELPKILPTMTRTIIDMKSKVKLIKDIEKIVRKSIEYRYYIQYLKNELDITKCSFLNKIDVSKRKYKKISLEFHHHPYTLWNIVEIVLDKKSMDSTDGRYNSFEVANDVMLLHYQNKVGLVPLTKTMHELAHAGKLEIAMEDVHGDVDTFYQEYKLFMSEDEIDIYTEFKKKTKKVTDNLNKHILTVNKQKIELIGMGEIKKIDEKNIKKLDYDINKN